MMWGYRCGFGPGTFAPNAWPWILGSNILGLLIFAGVIYFIIKLIAREKSASRINSSKALEILRQRFALGEISEEEYNHKKKILSS